MSGERAGRYLTTEVLDPAAWPQRVSEGQEGAVVEFLGIVRGEEEGRLIDALDYEAYVPMAERLIARLIDEAKQRWPLQRIEVRHRTGRIPVGQIAVAIRVRATHRAEAFSACQFLIDAIKRDVPIWKQPVSVRCHTA